LYGEITYVYLTDKTSCLKLTWLDVPDEDLQKWIKLLYINMCFTGKYEWICCFWSHLLFPYTGTFKQIYHISICSKNCLVSKHTKASKRVCNLGTYTFICKIFLRISNNQTIQKRCINDLNLKSQKDKRW